MTVALLGLLLLQFYWIRNVHQLTENRFKERVEQAIAHTAEDLEKIEATRLLHPEMFEQGLRGSYFDFVNSEFKDVMQVDETIEIRDTVINKDGRKYRFLVLKGTTIDTATGLLAEHRVITKNAGAIIPSDLENSVLSSHDSNTFAIQLNRSFEQQIMLKAQFLNEMMVKMFTGNYFDDISLRLNVNLLDSLIARNLRQQDLDTNFTFNVINLKGPNPAFGGAPNRYQSALKDTTYTTLLYPNDIVTGNYELAVAFPSKKILLWKEMSGTLIASLLLVLIVVIAFYLAVSTIYKQKQVSEIKNDFISNMTHELKTPISTISLACEAIRDPDVAVDAHSLQSFVSMIDQENKRLGKLVENVLQTSLLEKGKINLKRSKVNINELAKEVVDAFQIRFINKGGKIHIEKLDEVTANVDRIHFGNIIYNLLDNALKYSKDAPEVYVRLEKNNNGFSLKVRDNGVGIKKDDQKRIFDKLYRVPTGDVHNVKGFGLGLNYVDSIVRLHNGEITVDSTYGKGSTFKIKIKNE